VVVQVPSAGTLVACGGGVHRASTIVRSSAGAGAGFGGAGPEQRPLRFLF